MPYDGSLSLLQEQLAAIDRWHRYLRVRIAAEESVAASREARTEARNRIDSLHRTHEAIVAQTDTGIAESKRLLALAQTCRGVLVHRNAWWSSAVAEALEERAVTVVATRDDGAEGLGVAVVEQPDLLLLEHLLPSIPGEEVVRAVRELCPTTLLAAQVDDSDAVPRLIEAGVSAVFSRRIPPSEVADQVVAHLRERPTVPSVLV